MWGIFPPGPCTPHPPHRAFKKRHFASFVCVRNVKNTMQRQKYDTSCEICSVPWARAPTTYPPGTKALGPALPEPLPRQANLGFRAPATFALFGTAPTLPLLWKALGLPPCPPGQLRWVPPPTPQGSLQKTSFCGPETPAPTTYFPGTEALGPTEPQPRA